MWQSACVLAVGLVHDVPCALPVEDGVEIVRADTQVHDVELGLVRDVRATWVRRCVVLLRRRRRPGAGHAPVAPRRVAAAAPSRGRLSRLCTTLYVSFHGIRYGKIYTSIYRPARARGNDFTTHG